MKVFILLLVCCTLLLNRAEAAGNIANGLVLNYGFNEAGGTTCSDLTANKLNGQLVGGVVRSATGAQTVGSWGRCAVFPGNENARVETKSAGALSKLHTQLSLSLWFFPTNWRGATAATWKSLIRKAGSFDLSYNPALGQFRVQGSVASNPALSAKVAVPLNKWHHVAVQINGNQADIWLNRKKISGDRVLNVVKNNTSPVTLGNAKGITGDLWNGRMDEVRIYNRVLTAEEVLALNTYMAGPKPSVTPSQTRTRTRTPSQTRTRTLTPSQTRTRTLTPSMTRTKTPSRSPTPSITPSPSPKLWRDAVINWNFNGGSPNMVPDVTGHGCDAVPENGPTYVEGVEGTALFFNSTAWQACKVNEVPQVALSLAGAVSVSAWVRPEWVNGSDLNWDKNLRIVSKKEGWDEPDGFEVEYDMHNHEINFIGGDNTTARGDAHLPSFAWSHIACVADGENVRIYLNGEEVTKADQSTIRPITPSSIAMTIGRFANEYMVLKGCYWYGCIDQVRIFDVALSKEEVKALTSNP